MRLLCGLIAIFWAGLTAAHAGDILYVWADRANAATPYTANAQYTYNPAGSVKISEQLQPGIYRVEVNDLVDDPFVIAVATAYGTPGRSCNADTWGFDRVIVSCYDAEGNLARSRFTLMVIRAAEADLGKLAFAWVTRSSVSRGEAYVTQSFPNDYIGGEARAVTRTSAGRYRVALGDAAFDASAILVDATPGMGVLRRCTASRSLDAAGTVFVQCWDKDGNAADTAFSLLAIPESYPGVSFLLSLNSNGGTPDANARHRSNAGPQTVARIGQGEYEVTLGPQATEGGHIQLSSQSPTEDCVIRFWNTEKVRVLCTRRNSGQPWDSFFTVLGVKASFPPLVPLPSDAILSPRLPEWQPPRPLPRPN